ncbi:FHA domain-containing protein [Paraburkholderia sp. J63]|uniref:FHA domain-containing protein n=1 Tax=Paraburkholderia sp. J63 TaxID=2805434 RepID=UPI002ABD476E|nr:FHA domain-containing protein [Paraburkholderia sp. J63]
MNDSPRLLVASGLHAGASIALPEGHALKIGNGSGVDLILADAGVAPHHATVSLSGKRLLVHAVSDGVTVFGRILKSGTNTLLHHGASFGLGEARLQFNHGEPFKEGTSLRAERAWLLRHAPLAWLLKRFATLPRLVWFALAATALALAVAYGLKLYAPRPPRPHAPLLEQPAYRQVHVRTEKETGRRVYEGYVQSVGELGALSLDARAQGGAPVLRVAVIDVMQEQVNDFLDKYYRGAQLRAAGPGVFVATPPAADAYLAPESWDYARLDRLARAQIEGLKALRFAGHENDSGPVRIPLEALGLNLLSTSHTAWLADAQGTRYFAGARLPLGKITGIAGCGATVTRDDGSVYLLTVNRAAKASPC